MYILLQFVTTKDIILYMPKWNEFIPKEIEYDFEKDKLSAHNVDIEEAAQCFYNKFEIRKNKKFKDRFKLNGSSDAGRYLCIIFQLKAKDIVRIITGWER